MQIVRYILVGMYMIVCLWLMVLVMRQNKDAKGASGTIVGSSTTNNFYEKNKSRTHEGKLKKWTVIMGSIYLVFTVALGIIYVI